MERDELDQLLAELRAVGAEHGAVEAKRAENRLPLTAWQSLSAFANTDGGILLLGVDENGGAFDVTGVQDAAAVRQQLQSACSELEPPLRPQISIVDDDAGAVIVAELGPIARTERPCHRAAIGPYASSFKRVGDADELMTRPEVEEMLAGRARQDRSRRPAPEGAVLDQRAAAAFCQHVREMSDRNAEASEEAILRSWGVTVDGQPSIAGLLALGDNPAGITPAARIAYRRFPRVGDPEGARQAATHLEGTVGELLDDAVSRVRRDLDPVQVERDGHLFDDYDVPLVALREVAGNALLHRSLSDAQETTSVAIEVSEEAVMITSPGGVHVTADPALLGLDTISGVRNFTLVHVCEELSTPAGARIVENQASGIAAADRACRGSGTMPALFIDQPASFRVILLRGRLDTAAATELLQARGVEPTPDLVRVVSIAQRLERAIDETPISGLNRIGLDASLAARAVAPSTLDDGAAILRRLEDARVLERRHTRHGSSWRLRPVEDAARQDRAEQAPPRRRRQVDRVPDLLKAIALSGAGELSSSELGRELNLASTRSISGWIARAAEAGLIEATTESPYDPNRAYRLTEPGRALVARQN